MFLPGIKDFETNPYIPTLNFGAVGEVVLLATLPAPPCTSLHLRAPPCTSLHLPTPPCTSLHLPAPPCTSLHPSPTTKVRPLLPHYCSTTATPAPTVYGPYILPYSAHRLSYLWLLPKLSLTLRLFSVFLSPYLLLMQIS